MSELRKALDMLRNMSASNKSVENTKETWSRIGSNDPSLFEELGTQSIEDWMEENPYENIA